MIRSNLRDYSDAYIHVKGTTEVPNTGTTAAQNNRNKKVKLKNFAPFIKCMSKINNIQVDDSHDIAVVMPMYNLIEYSDTYSKTSGSLWQFFRDEAALDDNKAIIDFPSDNNNSISFTYKHQITTQTGNNGTKDVVIMVSLKCLSNFWRTREMLLIN